MNDRQVAAEASPDDWETLLNWAEHELELGGDAIDAESLEGVERSLQAIATALRAQEDMA